jgi:hypothetical protein
MFATDFFRRLFVIVGFSSLAVAVRADETESPRSPAPVAEEAIDFDRARELFRRRERGEDLTADESEYLQRALAARERMNRGGNGRWSPPGQRKMPGTPGDSIGLTPLTEMTADDRYEGEDGGLYGGGSNVPPEDHRVAAEAVLSHIEPLDAGGRPAPRGRVVFISISMSNATQEFSRFKRIADANPDRSRDLTIVDCAQGGQAMAEWAPPDAAPWDEADRRLSAARVTREQVQVAWIKLANKMPTGTLAEHGGQLQQDTLAVIQNAKTRFPNLRIVYLSSRIYGGYAANPLNPEPYAYESAFAARWLIQDQIAGDEELNYDPSRGDVRAPLLLWGPYLWADGMRPREADGLTYTRADLAEDGTHPSEVGRDKVARVMLEFFQSDPLARPWFVGPTE